MKWSQPREVLDGGAPGGELDAWRATAPCVLERPDGGLQMWYGGHDGSTERILTAVTGPSGAWQRGGVVVDAGASGDTDSFGVGSPCVVQTPAGLLMAYAGSDGENTRIHAAASRDGSRWEALGPLLQRGEEDAVGATHPCLVVNNDGWMLFFAGYDGSAGGEHSTILGAASPNGASWDRFGAVIEPERGETAVNEPCVLVTRRHFEMLYTTRLDDGCEIAMATSTDGVEWHRRGTILRSPTAQGVVRSPWAMRSRSGQVRLWYAATESASTQGERLWYVEGAAVS